MFYDFIFIYSDVWLMEEGVYKSENGQSHEHHHVVLARLYFSGSGMCGRDVGAGGACHHSQDSHACPDAARGSRAQCPPPQGTVFLLGLRAWIAWS